MPSYNYICTDCKKEFEVFHSISENTYKKCKQIKKNNCNENGKLIRKITGGSGLIFKGDGFYLTDYSQKNKKLKKKEINNDKNDSSK